MSRRSELEKQLAMVQKRIDSAPENTPSEVMEDWNEELDSIFIELNNLYDDGETESE